MRGQIGCPSCLGKHPERAFLPGSLDVPPPPLDPDDQRHPRFDPRYAGLKPEEIPAGESLEATIVRVLPYWHKAIVPDLEAGRRVLISAHGNSLRGLVKYLEDIPDDEIPQVEIPTGKPLIYELDEDFRVKERYYLEERSRESETTNSDDR